MKIRIIQIIAYILAALIGLAIPAYAAKLVSCIGVPAATGCTVSLVSVSGVTPTTIWSDEAMTEIADPGTGGLSNYVKAYGTDLDSTLDYFVYCNCGSYDWSYVWDITETRQDVVTSSRSSHSEADVWTTGGRELSTPDNYKANVSALALEATAQSILTDTGTTIPATLTGLATQSSVDTISTNLLRALGLMMENHVEDDIVRNATGLKTSSVIYIYDSAANATTHDKATGLTASYTVSATYNSSGRVTLFKVVKN